MPASMGRGNSGAASFSVYVPPSGSGLTTPQSLVVTLYQVNGSTPDSKPAPFVMNLASNTHGCTAMAGGAVSCTAVVTAPSGNDTFSLSTFAGLNGSGKQLSTTQAKATIKAGATTKCLPGAAASPAPTSAI